MKSLAILFFFLFPVTLFAMDMPVKVSSTTNDVVGQRLAFSIKEGIEKASSMHITYESEPSLVLSVVTLEGDRNNPGSFTTYSVSWLWNNPDQFAPFYLTSSVGTCGANKVEQCAHGLVADTQEQAEKMLEIIKLWVSSQPENSQ